MVDYVSSECRTLSSPFNNTYCGRYVFFKIENLWFAHWYYKELPVKISVFDNELEFERFYKHLKNKFRNEQQEKQFNPDVNHYNGIKVPF